MSGYTDDAIAHHGILESEMAFVHKPLLSQLLLAKVREVLNGRATDERYRLGRWHAVRAISAA